MICTACTTTATTWQELDGLPYHRTCAERERARRWLEGQGFIVVKRVIRRAS